MVGAGAGGGDKSRRLCLKEMGRQAAAGIMVDGTKALAPSGAAVVQQEYRPNPVALGQPALSLLDVLPVVQHATPEFAYSRQTTSPNLAAVVPAGAVKPTSVDSVTRIENSLVVIAHLSEGIARHWLIDNAALEAFLSNELEYGSRLAVEANVMTDVNATSGIQTQAYATSVLTTLRKGINKLEVAGFTPAAFVLAPADWESVELALSSVSAVEHLSLPFDPASRRLFGIPVTTSNAHAPVSGMCWRWTRLRSTPIKGA